MSRAERGWFFRNSDHACRRVVHCRGRKPKRSGHQSAHPAPRPAGLLPRFGTFDADNFGARHQNTHFLSSRRLKHVDRCWRACQRPAQVAVALTPAASDTQNRADQSRSSVGFEVTWHEPASSEYGRRYAPRVTTGSIRRNRGKASSNCTVAGRYLLPTGCDGGLDRRGALIAARTERGAAVIRAAAPRALRLADCRM
jgi:hypothetical protein